MAHTVNPSTTVLLVIGLFGILCHGWYQTELFVKDYDDAKCGERKLSRHERVKGSYRTRPGDWPWHAALYQRAEDRISFDYACGGSIVHRYLILTAAHCVTYAVSGRKLPKVDLLIKLGRFNLASADAKHSEEYGVRESIVHGGYVPATFENDIAVLRVAVPILFSHYIQPVCLWKRDDGFVLPNVIGLAGTVVGWGLTDENWLATALNEARMPVIDSHTCLTSDRTFFGGLLHAKAYCAGFKNGTGVCHGDSGGGMFFEFQNRWYLKGLVSFSNTFEESRRCNLQQYIGFTDASQYIDWLYANTPQQSRLW
ncbi:chymotrypsin-like elastase family member 2A [Anopheles darlingi]|uniref:chymotrypsin-like elastase family member 2A n=1 Tax=Anopheles darlingi TaxID=43151 RepID=UPI0021003B68|nr:chymotrypsin-like elastase family member 2A [Anopheles darlingi]